ncbi:MAG: DUF3293 domain-containing protein [Betaproteobacteria bacterium]|nr:DUF3293 domain-containing protein [Betaproteobacteria bacterium]
MPPRSELIAAYNAALYVVFREPELVIKIGEPNADLDALLEADGAASAAYVTVANPQGERRSDAENAVAFDFLKNVLKEKKIRFRAGEGRDPEDLWTPEPSVLVVGIGRADTEALGRRLEQIAIVFVEKGGAPELVLLDD